MEQLKRNTEKQYVEERFRELFDWMEQVEIEWDIAIKRARKNLNITFVVVVMQAILSFVLNSPLWMICFIIWMILFMRQGHLTADCELHKGRLLGANKALFLLGMVDIDIEEKIGKKRKRKLFITSPFKRFKEFFERMGAKNKTEVHA